MKEGEVKQVSDLDMLLQKNRLKKLILLDDNILSHLKSNDFLEEMVKRNIEVNFNQTLDIRLIDKEKAKLIKRIRCSNVKFTRRVYHFSLNDIRNLDLIRSKYQQLKFTLGDNVEFICMYGYNTNLADDLERFRFLRPLGAHTRRGYRDAVPGLEPARVRGGALAARRRRAARRVLRAAARRLAPREGRHSLPAAPGAAGDLNLRLGIG